MDRELRGKRVAMLVTDGFEQVELTEPRRALEEAGAGVMIVSPNRDSVRAWNHSDWGDRFAVDVLLEDASADNFDCLVLPGGVMNPDSLRCNEAALQLVREVYDSGKLVAAICHGPWTLIDAGVAEGARLTSYDSIQTDLRNAGAEWIDDEVVVDQNLLTSRKPDDLPAFNRALIEQIANGRHLRPA